MTRALVALTLAGGLLVAEARPAQADVTGFLGLGSSPGLRTNRGWSLGLNLLIVGFEFEFSDTVEDTIDAAPGVNTKMFNGLLITPTGDTQLYMTAGGGWFSESLGAHHESGFATNIGGGLKVKLAGPIRLRVDLRFFKLNDEALHRKPVRVYAGLNIAF